MNNFVERSIIVCYFISGMVLNFTVIGLYTNVSAIPLYLLIMLKFT